MYVKLASVRLTLGIALASLSVSALSQDIAPVFDMSVITNNAAMDSLRQSELRRAGAGGAFEVEPGRAVTPRARAQLRYRPNAGVRSRNFSRILSHARAADPVGARNLAVALKNDKVISNAQGWMSRYGMSTNDIADASASYLAIAWYATRGSNKDPSPAQMRGLRRQMATAMATTPGVIGASDAVKQEMAESNIVQAQLVSEYATLAKTKPAMANEVRRAVAQGARLSYGIDLLRVQFTQEGFH